MDVEALLEAPFVKNDQNGNAKPNNSPRERVGSSSRSHRRSPTPSSEHSRHSSSKRDYDRRDRDSSRHRHGHDDRDYRSSSRSRSRHHDDRYPDDRDRYEKRRSEDRYRDREDRYNDDRSDRRRSRDRDDYHDDDRYRKRRREVDDGDRSRYPDDRNSDKRNDPPQTFRKEPTPELTEEERDQRTVFVQQLAARLRSKEIIQFFEKCGPVREAQIVKDRISGRSKGVGYVEFRNPGSVSEAISMTGQRLLGIPIIVQITEAEKNRLAKATQQTSYTTQKPYLNGSHSGSSKEIPIHRLYIGNVHFNLTEDDIKAVFSPFGEIEQVQLQREHDTGRSRGYGFVQFRDPAAAKEALEKLNGFELAGRAIRVGLGNDKFTSESTQAILDRYDNFSGLHDEPPRGGAERLGGGSRSSAANLDDTDIAGVSFEKVSREALMKKLARRDEPKEEPAYDALRSRANASAKKVSNIPTPPTASRCVLLKNMFTPADETGETWVKDLEEDVKTECETKFGKVTHIHVEQDSEGEIYVKFDKVSSGEAAIQGLNGRWFDGRMIAASPISDSVYATKFPRARAL